MCWKTRYTLLHILTLDMLACLQQDRGTSLASNQVQYSLLYRIPEQNGVKQACEEGGTSLIAYSPLAQGLLTGIPCTDRCIVSTIGVIVYLVVWYLGTVC